MAVDTDSAYRTYPLYTQIDVLSVQLPKEVVLPTTVALTFTYPDGTNDGQHHITSNSRNVNFENVKFTLYQTGIYVVKYETPETITYEYFFVGSIDSRLVFDIKDMNVESGTTRFKVSNDGNMGGFCYMITYNDLPVNIGVKKVYNNFRSSSTEYIKNGYFKEFSESSSNVIILLNEKIYRGE